MILLLPFLVELEFVNVVLYFLVGGKTVVPEEKLFGANETTKTN